MTTAIKTIAALIDGAQPFGPWISPEAAPRDRGSDRRVASGRQAGAERPFSPAESLTEKPPDAAAAATPAPEHSGEQGLIGEICKNEDAAEQPPSRGPDMFGPRSGGYSIADMNREYALVLMGSKAVVFLEQPKAPIEDQQRMLTIEAFNAWHANRFTEHTSADNKVKLTTWSKAWLQSKDRRSYLGVEFHPDRENAVGMPGYLNLWSGFAIAPAKNPDARKYGIFRDHLLTNVCSGDEQRFKWVFGFFAHIVQRPRERIGTALVLRGKMGSGKSKVGEVIGKIFPRHYFMVDDPRYVTGNFNAHMATCLLLQADEAVWAGDKSAEGRLRGLITSPIQQIEAKGVDPIRLPNYVRLIMTSNEDWVVPAGKDERRFTVLDVGPNCAQNHQYFREMDEELEAGGLEHLLADLLAFDLDSINLRQVLRTDALLEQKIRSLDSVESWWFERLQAGDVLRSESAWLREVVCDTLYSEYVLWAEKIGIRRKREPTVFGMTLNKIVPDLDRVRRTRMSTGEYGAMKQTRPWVYLLPPIESARRHWEQMVGQRIRWPALPEEPTREMADEMA